MMGERREASRPATTIESDRDGLQSIPHAYSDLCFLTYMGEYRKGGPGVYPASGKQIFVVDDEPIIATTIAAILRISGFSARPFTNPLQALNAARLETPDLLISDVITFGISGVELALLIKEECPNCKILLFSGQARTADLLWSGLAEGNKFEVILKSVHPNDFLCKVNSLVEVLSSSD
jgi:DNA-binding NtrC family response regulator